MKKLICLIGILSLASCVDPVDDTPIAVYKGEPGDEDQNAGSETVNGVVQPKGAIKRILDVKTDNRGWHTMDFDDTYVYDAEGRVIIDKCTQSIYENETGKFLFKDDYEYWRVYSGTNYEWRNGPEPETKAWEGELNAKGQLKWQKSVNMTKTFTYDADGRLIKEVKESNNTGETTTYTFSWNAYGNIESSTKEVSKNGSVQSTVQYGYSYDRAHTSPTNGHFYDLMYICFPDEGPYMLQGPAPKNLLYCVYIIPSGKASLSNVERYFTYEWDAAGKTIVKMVRHIMVFPCAEEQVFLNERDIDTYTFEYYK